MKVKKFLALLTLAAGIMILTGTAFSAPVERALSKCPDESVYMVLKLDDAQGFMKWLLSKQHIDTFMPLILASEDSNEILGVIEMLSAFAENTPLESTALLAGMPGNSPEPFFQMAFTVKPEAEPFLKRVSDGSASPVDIAKLFLGAQNPLASLAESMIKVEKTEDNILRIDNELYMKAFEDMIILGISADSIKSSIEAAEHSDLGLFGSEGYTLRLSDNDFAFMHMDVKSVKALNEALDDDDKDKKDDDLDVDIEKYFDKPVNIELGFSSSPEKFVISTAINFKEALKQKYLERLFKNEAGTKSVKGGYLNLAGVKAPLLAFGGYFDIAQVRDADSEIKPLWNSAIRNLKRRFGITEEDVTAMFKGAFSVTINDNVNFDTFKIPALYSFMTADPENFFGKLSKSQHFHKVQEGVLQIDSSISPVSCLVENKGDTLGIHFAELENISAKPVIKPALEKVLERESISSTWIDFEEIRGWILNSENGVLPILEPLARFTGYGEIFDAVKDVLSAEFSVPSMAIIAESFEIVHTEFNIAEINPDKGLITKLMSISKKFMNLGKADDIKSDDKAE